MALTALVMVVAITAGWWALALWPTGTDAPQWLERTRAVCFGATHGSLPSAAGWIVLISEPFGMLAFLLLVWADDLREALGVVRRSLAGRVALGVAALAIVVGVGAATARVASAAMGVESFDPRRGAGGIPDRLDRPAPPLTLVDQRGDTIRLDQFLGRPVIVAFAYAHCETVCPLIVHDAVAAVAQAKASNAALLVVTLDPWRDTPARLAAIAQAWNLPPGAHLLGGSVDEVVGRLDAWQIARARDEKTGEIVHPTSVHLLDRRGRLAFIAGGNAKHLQALIERL
jgi:protein SCO1/2